MASLEDAQKKARLQGREEAEKMVRLNANADEQAAENSEGDGDPEMSDAESEAPLQGVVTWPLLRECKDMAMTNFEQGWCALYSTTPCGIPSFSVDDFQLDSYVLPPLSEADLKALMESSEAEMKKMTDFPELTAYPEELRPVVAKLNEGVNAVRQQRWAQLFSSFSDFHSLTGTYV